MKIFLTIAVLSLTACATVTTPAPDTQPSPHVLGNLTIKNATPPGGPRIYFTDGITTLKTDYYKWTEVVIKNFADGLPKTVGAGAEKSISISIQSINCTGHYVPDCAVSIYVQRSDGQGKIYSTDSLNSYPIERALRRALTAATDMALSDGDILRFAGQ